VHFESAHTWSAEHAVLQSPQWAGSLSSFTHALPHSANPALQSLTHLPAEQVACAFDAALQACPQSPQFFASFVRSWQSVPQRSRSPVQMKLHAPSTHTGVAESGAEQRTEHPPQFAEL
jgi:hypothetical protein